MRLTLILVSFIIAAVFWMNVAVSSFGQTESESEELYFIEETQPDGTIIEWIFPASVPVEEAQAEMTAAFVDTGVQRLAVPRTFYYNPTDAISGGTTPYLAGVRAWNDAGANFQYVYDGQTTHRDAYAGGAPNVVMIWDATEGTQAIGWARFGGGRCTAALDPKWVGWNSRTVWLVAAHEAGHCLGLGHSEFREAVMWFSCCSQPGQALHSDDINGIRTMYGVGPASTPVPTLVSTTIPTATVVPPTLTPTPVPKTLWPGWNLIGGTGESPGVFISHHQCVTQIYQWNPDTRVWLRHFVDAPGYVNNIVILHPLRVHWVYCQP